MYLEFHKSVHSKSYIERIISTQYLWSNNFDLQKWQKKHTKKKGSWTILFLEGLKQPCNLN